MNDLYREAIIDHYKNPRNKGRLDSFDYSFEDDNPLCGDNIRIEIKTDANDLISEAKFNGHGCAVSIASADLLLDEIIGKPLNEMKELTKKDMLGILGIEDLGPVRMKCALLSLKVLKGSLYGTDSREYKEIDED